MDTTTVSPGEAVPQTGVAMPRCKTMFSLKSAEGLTTARELAGKQAVHAKSDRHATNILMLNVVWGGFAGYGPSRLGSVR